MVMVPCRARRSTTFSLSIRAGTLRLASAALTILLAASTAPAQLVEAGSFRLDDGVFIEESAIFGEASVVGDFDGDGFDDLAVGASRADLNDIVNAGIVSVFFGGPQGLERSASVRLTQNNHPVGSECGGPEAGDNFGFALAAGDFNDDQRADLVVGSPGEGLPGASLDAGVVSVFFGRADQTFETGPCLVAGAGALPGATYSNARFGHALAVGDFGTPGFDDLAIGAPGAEVDGVSGAGAVTVIYSSAGHPLDPASSQIFHQNVDGVDDVAEEDDAFGYALASGDLVLGQDSACDLAVGAPGESDTEIEEGTVHVLFGCGPSGLAGSQSVQYRGAAFPDTVVGEEDQMGAALAVGNFDCQGAEDLAIGVPGRAGETRLEGEVWIVSGNQMGTPSFESLDQAELGLEPEIFDSFGVRVAALDLGGACTDLLIGESSVFPGNNSDEAFVHLLEGRPGVGIVAATPFTYSQPEGGNFGWSMNVGLFDGVERQVAIGGPGLDVDGVDKAGAVVVYRTTGLFSDGFESGTSGAWSLVVD